AHSSRSSWFHRCTCSSPRNSTRNLSPKPKKNRKRPSLLRSTQWHATGTAGNKPDLEPPCSRSLLAKSFGVAGCGRPILLSELRHDAFASPFAKGRGKS